MPRWLLTIRTQQLNGWIVRWMNHDSSTNMLALACSLKNYELKLLIEAKGSASKASGLIRWVADSSRGKKERESDGYFGLVICTSFMSIYGESDGEKSNPHQCTC